MTSRVRLKSASLCDHAGVENAISKRAIRTFFIAMVGPRVNKTPGLRKLTSHRIPTAPIESNFLPRGLTHSALPLKPEHNHERLIRVLPSRFPENLRRGRCRRFCRAIYFVVHRSRCRYL